MRQLDELKTKAFQLAIHRARELNIDDAVRTVARNGRHDASIINFWAEFDGLVIRATFGAGTNSASVRLPNRPVLEPEYLYRADDYGNYIDCFRYGPWVHRLLAEAERLEALAEVEKQVARIADEQRRAKNYEEVDY